MTDKDPKQYMMTVRELAEMLADHHPDAYVVMQCDAEGNGYSPLAGIEGGNKYRAENTWSGEVPHPEDLEDYEDEDLADMIDCVVIYPIS